MGRGRGYTTNEVCSLSGIFKLLEIVTVVCALVIHRVGNHGNYVFFGTTGETLQQSDPNLDLENLGNGTLVTYAIISSVLLCAYVLDGRFVIQSLFLEMLWNFIGCILFLGAGIRTMVVWAQAKKEDDMAGQEDYFTKYSAGMALGGLCCAASLLYFLDFIISSNARKRLKRDAY